MFPSRLAVTFDSNLLDHQPAADGLRALAHLTTRLLQRLRRQAATVEFAVIAFWAFTPFVAALLIS